jgi:hypothetical protein
MPLLTMPPDDILIALGKLVLQFAELEYWINMGIIEAENIAGAAEQARVARLPFNKRVDRLQEALGQVEGKGWTKFGEDGVPAVDFLPKLKDIANERNDLIHGATFNMMSRDLSRSFHTKVNLRIANRAGPVDVRVYDLDKSMLDRLSEQASNYAEALKFAVLDLSLAKQWRGVQPLAL